MNDTLFCLSYTPCRFPTMTRPQPINTRPKIKNSSGSTVPSPVFGVSSNVWLPEDVPAVLEDVLPELTFDTVPEPVLPVAELTEAPLEPELPDVLPELELLPAALPEPEEPDVLPPELPEPEPLPADPPELLPDEFPEPELLPEPLPADPPEPLPAEPPEPELPPEEPPRSTDVLPAPLSSISSLLSSSSLPLSSSSSSPTSTLVLPAEEEEEVELSSSLLSDELPPSRLENT